ncbi:MAG: hypothetical protein HGA75_16505 [Thiobacillus sp.]|nr:hypothetical protein [Thiobacillus sp.]
MHGRRGIEKLDAGVRVVYVVKRRYRFQAPLAIKGFTVAKRSVFVIDKSGTVRYRWVAPEPKVEPNYAEVTAAVKKL